MQTVVVVGVVVAIFSVFSLSLSLFFSLERFIWGWWKPMQTVVVVVDAFVVFSLFSLWKGWSKVAANLCRLLSGGAEKLWIVPRPHSSFSDRSKIIDIWVIRSGLTTELAWWKWRQWQCKAKILPGPTKKRPGLVLVPATFGDSDVWHWALWWLNFWGMRHVTLSIMGVLGSFDSCTWRPSDILIY